MASRQEIPSGVFAPKASRQESKADATTTVARSIVSAEAKARDVKTERLRALRLAQEEAAPPPPAKPAAKSRARKAAR